MKGRAKPKQLALDLRRRTWGGARKGAGRKPKGARAGVSHMRRPVLEPRFPVHVTLKVLPTVPHLRRGACFRAIRQAFVAAKQRFGFRLAQFSVQGNHMHLICEAEDSTALSRGMQGLSVRIARRLNDRLGRSGRLFADRYHARILKSPTEVRNCLVYVLNNNRHHRRQQGASWVLDPFSSAPYFKGWRNPPRELWLRPEGPDPVVEPTTWLLKTGWRSSRGAIAANEAPA